MSFGFGVGDFLAGIDLIIRIGTALSDSAGSKKELQDLVAQFRAFEYPLIFAKRYAEAHRQEMEEVELLQELLREFVNKINDIVNQLDKYLSVLGPAYRVSFKDKSKANLAKIQFHFLKSKDIAKWQQSLMIHSLAMNTLFGIITNSEVTSLKDEWDIYRSEDRQQTQLITTTLQNVESNLSQLSRQIHAVDPANAVQDSITAIASVQGSVTIVISLLKQALRDDESRQSELLATKRSVQDMQKSMEMNFTKLLSMSNDNNLHPVTFEDACGIISHFHTDWVFQAHLEERWKDIPGLHLVKRHCYILNDAYTGERIQLQDPISSIFTPGRKILMSMLYQHFEPPISYCPGCYGIYQGNANLGRLQCLNCGLTYRIIEDTEPKLLNEYVPFAPIHKDSCGTNELSGYVRIQIMKIKEKKPAIFELQSGYDAAHVAGTGAAIGSSNSSNISSFNQMLEQYFLLQQQTMIANMEMQKALAYWNPSESMSKRDATS